MRCDDSHYDYRKWTNAKLMREVRKYANLESLSIAPWERVEAPDSSDPRDKGADAVRAATQLYRDSWLNPLLDELERRFLKVKASASTSKRPAFPGERVNG